MQVAKEMNVMFATKKIMAIVRKLVTGLPLAALLVIVGMAGTAAARPVVVSSNPADDAVNVPINTAVTVNFDRPVKCKTINQSTFRLKVKRNSRLAVASITCSGSTAVLTPASDLL